MKFEQVCQTLINFFSQNSLVRICMPVCIPFMLICAAIQCIDDFISLGSVVHTAAFLGFLFALLLTLSVCSFRKKALSFAENVAVSRMNEDAGFLYYRY